MSIRHTTAWQWRKFNVWFRVRSGYTRCSTHELYGQGTNANARGVCLAMWGYTLMEMPACRSYSKCTECTFPTWTRQYSTGWKTVQLAAGFLGAPKSPFDGHVSPISLRGSSTASSIWVIFWFTGRRSLSLHDCVDRTTDISSATRRGRARYWSVCSERQDIAVTVKVHVVFLNSMESMEVDCRRTHGSEWLSEITFSKNGIGTYVHCKWQQ